MTFAESNDLGRPCVTLVALIWPMFLRMTVMDCSDLERECSDLEGSCINLTESSDLGRTCVTLVVRVRHLSFLHELGGLF